MKTFGWSRELSTRKELEKKFPDIDSRFLFVNTGFNFRPTELQGAFGIHQIDKLEKLVKIRIKNAEYLNEKLSKFSNLLLSKIEKGKKKSYLFYPIIVKKNKFFKKDELVKELEKNGVETRPVMAGNMTKQPVAKILKFKKSGKLVNSDYIHDNAFIIGNHHEMGEKQRKFIADIIIKFIDRKEKR